MKIRTPWNETKIYREFNIATLLKSFAIETIYGPYYCYGDAEVKEGCITKCVECEREVFIKDNTYDCPLCDRTWDVLNIVEHTKGISNESEIFQMLRDCFDLYDYEEVVVAPDIAYEIEITIPNWNELCQQIEAINLRRKHYEAREKELMDMLKRLTNYRLHNQDGYKLNKICRKGSVDYSSIPELKCVNLELFRKEEVEVWKLERDVKNERWIK